MTPLAYIPMIAYTTAFFKSFRAFLMGKYQIPRHAGGMAGKIVKILESQLKLPSCLPESTWKWM